MATELYRWLRVLEYIGSREEIDRAVASRQVKGESPPAWQHGAITIKEAFIGEVPELLSRDWWPQHPVIAMPTTPSAHSAQSEDHP